MLLVNSRWAGAELSSIATQELAPYLGDGAPRARIDGPDVVLMPNTAQALAVTLHELATNAGKYGSLSLISRSLAHPGGALMSSKSERRIAFAQICRLRAASTCSPFQREYLLTVARLSDYEAELVEHSQDCIAESKDLIARAETFLQAGADARASSCSRKR